MHIAVDARIINSTTGRYVERLLHYLQEIDTTNQYSVLVRQKDSGYWKATNKNFTVIVAEFDNYSLSEQIGYNRFLKKLHPDLVHFCMPQQPVLYKGKKVTTFHDLTLIKTYNSDKNWLAYHVKQFIGRFVFHSVARSSDHVITDSNFSKNEIIAFSGVDEHAISTIYLAGETATGATQTYKLPFKRYLLYVGQQSDYKNIKRLGEAHQKLRETYPDLGLVLAGKKNSSALRNEAYFTQKEYSGIHFTDFVSDEHLNWLYAHAEVYVFPSLMEGFGLPGLEAMAQGTPVVSSNATCLPEVYGNAASYFDPKDTNDMARVIAEVLGNPALKRKLSAAGYQRIKKYSWKKMAKETYAVYMSVLKK